MPTITVSTWTSVPGAEGYYAWAGPAPGLYPYRSAAPVLAPPATVTVPTGGTWYVAVCGYVTVDGVPVYGPLSDPVMVTVGAAPTGFLVLTVG